MNPNPLSVDAMADDAPYHAPHYPGVGGGPGYAGVLVAPAVPIVPNPYGIQAPVQGAHGAHAGHVGGPPPAVQAGAGGPGNVPKANVPKPAPGPVLNITAPSLPNLTVLGKAKTDEIIKLFFGKLIKLEGAKRRAEATLLLVVAKVPEKRVEPTRQVKSNAQLLDAWQALSTQLAEVEKKAEVMVTTAYAERARQAYSQLLGCLQAALTSGITNAVIPSPDEPTLTSAALVEYLLAPPTHTVLMTCRKDVVPHGDIPWSAMLDVSKWCTQVLPGFMEVVNTTICNAVKHFSMMKHIEQAMAKACIAPEPVPEGGNPEHLAAAVAAAVMGIEVHGGKKKRKRGPSVEGSVEGKGGEPAPSVPKPGHAKGAPRPSKAKGPVVNATGQQHHSPKHAPNSGRGKQQAVPGKGPQKGTKPGQHAGAPMSVKRRSGFKTGSTDPRRKPSASAGDA